jgi:hypothetical protein
MHPELLDRFTAVTGFAYQNHVWLNCDQCGDPFAYYRVVIDRKNSNSSRAGTHGLSPDSVFVFLANNCDNQLPFGAVA